MPTKRPTETITALVAAVLAVLVAFDVPLTDVQIAALIALVGATAPLVTWVVARRRGE